jgi:hypothetical protein
MGTVKLNHFGIVLAPVISALCLLLGVWMALMPEDAKEATGQGVRAKQSRSGIVSFDLLASGEGSHAAV